MSKRGKGQHCHYCKRRLEAAKSHSQLAATRDHVTPKSFSVTVIAAPTVWCCRLCNRLKGDMLIEEWAAFMQTFPRWWTLAEFKHGGNARRALLAYNRIASQSERAPETVP